MVLIVVGIAAVGFWGVEASHRHGIYYRLMYMVVAKDVTAGARTPAEQVDRLAAYVAANVRTPDDAPLDENGSPGETLVWGFGYSDQQVRLFLKLVQEEGIPNREVFLIDPTDGSSPRTDAEVLEDGRWNLVDVAAGYAAKRADGTPESIAEALASPDDLARLQAKAPGLQPSDYRDARRALEYRPGRLAAAEHLVARLMPRRLADGLQDAYLRLPPPIIAKPDGFSRFTGYSSADGQLYWRARNHQLFGRTDLATAEYQRLLAAYPKSAYAGEARSDLALLSSNSA